MKRLKAKNVYYEIEKLLGDGLTSEVYKAFRRDGRGWTKQPVALKIIKSKNDVQILKREFESLTRIKSKYCVRVHAWENLPKGPGLVLEYIDGLTLHQILKSQSLERELLLEILAQVRLGLLALHRGGVTHGDLNLKNIMVSKDGIVKLIDFGVAGVGESQLMTLSFASENRKSGGATCPEDDFVSLDKIAQHLEQQFNLSGLGEWKTGSTRASRRRILCQTLQFDDGNSLQTMRVEKTAREIKLTTKVPRFVAICCFFIILLSSLFSIHSPTYFSLDLRSKNWFQYSVNGLPVQYGPRQLRKLRKGAYRVEFKRGQKSQLKDLDLSQARTILLKPGDNLL